LFTIELTNTNKDWFVQSVIPKLKKYLSVTEYSYMVLAEDLPHLEYKPIITCVYLGYEKNTPTQQILFFVKNKIVVALKEELTSEVVDEKIRQVVTNIRLLERKDVTGIVTNRDKDYYIIELIGSKPSYEVTNQALQLAHALSLEPWVSFSEQQFSYISTLFPGNIKLRDWLLED
jgi:hypothetical protein